MTLTTLQRDVEELRHTVYGNGDAGLKMRVHGMETTVANLVQSRREARRWFMGIFAAIIVATVSAIAGQFWQAAKIQATNDMMERVVRQATTQIQSAAKEIKTDTN